MEEVPKSVPLRLKAMASGDHPDPDLLAALAEQALPERERVPVLLHLSRCADCREVLALAIPPAAATASPSLDTGRRSWFQWRVLRWAAAGACVVIVGSAVLIKRNTMMTAHEETPRTETAASVQNRSDSLAYTIPDESAPSAKAIPEQKAVNGMEAVERGIADKANQVKTLKKETPVLSASPASPPRLSAKVTEPMAGARVAAGVGGGASAGLAYHLEGRFASAPAPKPAPAEAAWQRREKELSQARDTTDLTVVEAPRQPAGSQQATVSPQNNAVIEVQAASPTVKSEETPAVEAGEKHETPGKAKVPSNIPTLNATEQAADEGSGAYMYSLKKTEVTKAAREREAAYSPVSRWTISSDGQLQHSTDSGRTWQPVSVAEKASFRALSANGPDIWVGGAAGLLYHSADSGDHWTQVKPAANGSNLTADIAAIEFTDTRQGKITTANGEIWLTRDGGKSWSKQP